MSGWRGGKVYHVQTHCAKTLREFGREEEISHCHVKK